jgi:two-component system sensor histidine kinase KdpD
MFKSRRVGRIRGEASGVGLISEVSKRWLWPGLTATALVALATAILLAVYLAWQGQHLIFGYLIPMVIVAARYGSIPALLTAIACDLCAAYFLYPPDFSFYISDPLQIAELSFFSLLALAISQFVGGLADDERLRRTAAYRYKKAR